MLFSSFLCKDNSDLSDNIDELKNANTIGITTTTPPSTDDQIDNAELQNKDSVSNGVLDDNENDNEHKMNDDGTKTETASVDLNNGSNKNEPYVFDAKLVMSFSLSKTNPN